MIKIFTILAAISLLIYIPGCKNQPGETSDQKNLSDSLSTAGTGSGAIFSMPAPLQIANMLRKSKPEFYSDLLIPQKKELTMPASEVQKALLLGMISVDMGYSVVYERQQILLDYAAKAKILSQELGISGAFTPQIIQRLENNMNNIDSLSYLVLSSFNDVNNYFIENDRQQAGILVLTGGFVEGLYLSTVVAYEDKSETGKIIVGQQKFFLDNTLKLIDPDKSDSILTNFLNNLIMLKQDFDKIEITYSASKDPFRKKVDKLTMTEETLVTIKNRITEIRNKILF
ncbi:MAG: hypothetical protein HY738_02190 [Bacteroidia bacterium]|nr:hypothetical protein [Bacteroidia bacterium]